MKVLWICLILLSGAVGLLVGINKSNSEIDSLWSTIATQAQNLYDAERILRDAKEQLDVCLAVAEMMNVELKKDCTKCTKQGKVYLMR